MSPVPRPAVRPWTWAGAGLFVASLGYFLFSYGLTFGESHQGPVRVADVVWNTGLFTVFALHHSLFARPRARAVVARTVPAGLERTFYVALASLLFIGVCAAWRPIPGTLWRIGGSPGVALLAVQAAGLWLSIRSATFIDVGALAGLSSETGAPPAFRRDGPYGWVRHPIYTGWFLIVFATPVMTMTRLTFAVVSGIYILAAIPLEERTLRAQGDGYGRYAAQVRWRIVPGVY